VGREGEGRGEGREERVGREETGGGKREGRVRRGEEGTLKGE